VLPVQGVAVLIAGLRFAQPSLRCCAGRDCGDQGTVRPER